MLVIERDGLHKTVAVCGGDEREIVLMQGFLERGFEVHSFGHPWALLPDKVSCAATVRECIFQADALILPMPGVRENGLIYNAYCHELPLTDEDMSLLAMDTPVLAGVASDYLKRLCDKYRLQLLATAELDEIAVLNAIPTAEGAISLAINSSKEFLCGSRAAVIGFGRVANALAERLAALGVDIFVANRGGKRRYQAAVAGYNILDWDNWYKNPFDFIFNTVPAPVINREMLQTMGTGTVIIDLAASPGGTDFHAACELGIKAILASSLPGKYAPLGAGKILSAVYPSLVIKMINGFSDEREG